MGLAEQMERDRLEAEDAADAQDALEAHWCAEFAVDWQQMLASRSLQSPSGLKHSKTLGDVISNAMAGDTKIFDTVMQGLVHCAARGQIEAVQALEAVRTEYINERLEQRRARK